MQYITVGHIMDSSTPLLRGGLPDVVRPIQRHAAGRPSPTIHEWRPEMSTETNKQIARSFLQSVDD
jgi:hypothetical protein